MQKRTLLEEYLEDPNHMRLFHQERAIYEVTDLIEAVMEEQGITRTELARRLGKTKGWVTQLLDGEANKTIRTVADAFTALGQEFHSFSKPIKVGVPAKPSLSRNTAARKTPSTRRVPRPPR